LGTMANDSIQAEYDGVLAKAQGEAGHRDLALQSLEAAVKIAEKRRASLRTDTDRMVWARDSAGLFSQLVELKLDSQDPVGALRVLERFQDEPDNGIQESPATLPEPSSATVLVYSLLSDGVGIWKLNNQGIVYRRVAKDPQYVRLLVDRFKDLCATPSTPLASVHATSRQLYQILIEPVSDLLRPKETVLLVPGAFLAGVPFEALQDRDGSYFVERHAVVYAAGLGDISNAPEAGRVSSKMRVLAVANAGSYSGSHLPRLAEVTTEAEDVAHQFQDSQVLENEDATYARIRRDLPRSEVFHFAGHTGSRAGGAGLLLAEAPGQREKDSVLDLYLLERLNLAHLKLVVLSSCATGEEDHFDETTPESLAQAFVHRGVPHVVATRWNVDSRSDAALMRQFYRLLLGGRPVAEAMADAEVQLLHTEPHPYYWAVYDVLGRQ